MQGTYLEEPLFGPDGSLPKVIHERRLPEEQFDQQTPNIPIDPLKGIYPEGQGVISNSKAKTETPAPEPQNPIVKTASPGSEIMNNDAETDTLKLERVKTLPNEKDSSLLPESMNTEEDTSGVVP